MQLILHEQHELHFVCAFTYYCPKRKSLIFDFVLLFTLFRLFFISFRLCAGPVDSFAECRYWCRSKASVAKVLNWHDRAIKERQRSILPSFTLQHSPRRAHLLHTVADKRHRYWTHFPCLSRILSRESRRLLVLHFGVCAHVVKLSVVSLVKEKPVIG